MFDPAGAILFFLVGLLVAGSGRRMVILLAVVPVFWFGLWLQSDAALYGDGPIDPPFWIFCGSRARRRSRSRGGCG